MNQQDKDKTKPKPQNTKQPAKSEQNNEIGRKGGPVIFIFICQLFVQF